MKSLIIRCLSALMRTKHKLLFGKRFRVGNKVILNHKLQISGPGSIEIHDNANLWAFDEPTRLQTYDKHAQIIIGKNTRLNGCLLQAREKIEIGEDCMLGSCIVMDNDFHHVEPLNRREKKNIPSKPVIIKNNVWLAGQSVVLKGVTIGKNSVVGFRAVVTKDVSENTVVAGNPAKVVKEFL